MAEPRGPSGGTASQPTVLGGDEPVEAGLGVEPEGAVQQQAGENGGDAVVGDDAPTAGEILCRTGEAGLQDVAHAEQQVTGDDDRPACSRGSDEDDRQGDDFVEYDWAGVAAVAEGGGGELEQATTSTASDNAVKA